MSGLQAGGSEPQARGYGELTVALLRVAPPGDHTLAAHRELLDGQRQADGLHTQTKLGISFLLIQDSGRRPGLGSWEQAEFELGDIWSMSLLAMLTE